MSKKNKITQAATLLTAASTAARFYSDYRLKWDARRKHTLSIQEDSYVFIPLMKWIMENTIDTKHHKLIAYSYEQYTILDPSSSIKFNLGNYVLKLENGDEKPKVESNEHGELDVTKPSVTFSCQNKAGIDALVRLVDELREKKRTSAKEVMGYNCASYGWNGRLLPKRNLDNIFLPRGVKESLMSDIELFLGQEEKYQAIGAPWHRGYLLYGPPGNGKTSLVQGLAHYYKRNVYNMSLSSITNDSVLLERLRDIDKDSFLLIEDIDIFRESVVREGTKNSGPTLAGLLNGFDGINTPNGLVTFFTTNVIETLDDALIRPGRMDMHIELTAPVRYQIEGMFEKVYDEPLGFKPREFGSMAEYADILKRHIDDVESARMEIKSGAAR